MRILLTPLTKAHARTFTGPIKPEFVFGLSVTVFLTAAPYT